MNAEIEDNIRKKVSWINLPSHIKQILNSSPKDYDRYIVSFSIKNQLRYRGNLVRHVLKDEKRYYERIVAYSREKLMLFPYHLADMIVKGLRITPFNYYISVVEKLMQTEKSYDTLPNFTAADCLRLLGIGRNEYIELMNKSRSNKSRLFGRVNVRSLLPKVPCDIHIEPWWRVEVGLVLEEDIKLVNEVELALIDRLIDYGSQTAGELNYNIVLSLYKKGFIYLDVPITAADCIQVPPLQGFVMNRVLGDYFETLLYKIFVSIDEHTTVGELAGVLQVDTELVKQAVSLYCRLQFARKIEAENDPTRIKLDPSWNCIPPPETKKKTEITPLTLTLNNGNNQNISQDFLSPQNEMPESPANANPTLTRKGQRIAFLYDATLTAYLMMGNLSPGLKKHAVTMFEVGKLCDESLDSFLAELEKVSALDAEGEGEARRFFDHAVILRSTVFALRKLYAAGLDLVRMESLRSLDEATCHRLLERKYKLLVSMAPLSREVRPIVSYAPPHLGPAVPEVNAIWFKLFLYHVTGYGPPSLLLIRGTTLEQLPRMFLGYSRLLVTAWLHEPAVIHVANILHVNAALQYSPVLIQAYGVHRPGQTAIVPFPFRLNDAHSAETMHFDKHPAVKEMYDTIDIVHNCGYLTFANIGVLDFGCLNKEKVVRLGRTLRNFVQPRIEKLQNEPTSITNENFSFESKSTDGLRTPVETHFALTPVGSESSSPANGFITAEGSELLRQEVESVETNLIPNTKPIEDLHLKLDDTLNLDGLTTPSEEKVNFSRHAETFIDHTMNENQPNGEVWTLLDCHFGIPLFDVNANTKICDTILAGGLAETDSLEKLVESSRRLSTVLLDFISQCQYYPGENMEIMKRGRLVPLPRHNLIFDNGKISEWSGK